MSFLDRRQPFALASLLATIQPSWQIYRQRLLWNLREEAVMSFDAHVKKT